MCGIHGWAGKDPKDFNIHKLNILGILNETRGTHSCGITYNGAIYNGISKESKWRDFCSQHTKYIEKELEIPVVLGHTRFATVGAHTASNAHPFGFGGKNNIFNFVGVHNGSLLNHRELAEKYKIRLQTKSNSNNPNIVRHKIDSEVLLEVIYRHGIEILNFYEGAAALLWQDLKDPNVVYAYHGKSSIYKYGAETEERPLFAYKESNNSVYFSSQEESLDVINDTDDLAIIELEHNIVYKITDGDIDNAEKFSIDRTQQFQKTYTRTTRHIGTTNHGPSSHTIGDPETKPNYNESSRNEKKEGSDSQFSENTDQFNIFKEKPILSIEQMKPGQVYYNKLRYWSQGELCTGIFTPLKINQMQHMGRTKELAEQAYSKVASKYKFSEEPMWFYIYKGVMLLDELDYTMCLNNEFTDYETLSHMSRYPIIDVNDSQGFARHYASIITDEFIPILSKRIYSIFNGSVIEARHIGKTFEENEEYIIEDDIEYYNLILNDMKSRVKKGEDSIEDLNKNDIEYITKSKDEISEYLQDFINDEDIINISETRKSFVSAITEVNEITKSKLSTCLQKINKSRQLVEK